MSLLELLICLTIIGLLAAMLLPAVQVVRATAAVSRCQNNLRQIGLGIQHYHDARGHLPRPRLCPAPWQGGTDPFCTRLATAAQYTGPAEQWWAPYDNRPGATPTAALADYRPDGLIFPFVGSDARVFRCPDGVDRTPTSPSAGRRFQVGYALFPLMGGRNLAEYVGTTVTEHDDVPYCPGPLAHHTGWPTPASQDVLNARHTPARHNGALSIARSDGSVTVRR